MINQAGATLSYVLLLAPGRCLIIHTNTEKRYNGSDKNNNLTQSTSVLVLRLVLVIVRHRCLRDFKNPR